MKKNRESLLKVKVITILAFLCVIGISAQKSAFKKDSFYYKKTYEFSHINNDSLIYFARKLQFSQDGCLVIRGLIAEAKAYYQKNDFERAKESIYSALKKTEQYVSLNQCRSENLINIYRRLFYIYKNQNDYEKALEYLRKREFIVSNLPVKDYYYQINKLNVTYSEASLKIELSLFDQAAKILINAKRDLTQFNRKKRSEEENRMLTFYEANIYNTLGNVYINTFKNKQENTVFLDSAELCYKKAYDLIKPLPNTHTKPLYLIKKSKVSLLRKDYELTLFHLNRYRKIEKQYPEYLHMVYYYKSMAYWYLKNYNSAIEFGKKYLKEYEKNPGRNKFLLAVYDNLTKSYMALGENSAALKYSSLSIEKYKDLERNKDKTLANIFEVNKVKREEVEELNEILLSEKRKTTIFNYIYLVGGGLFIISVYFFSRKKKKKTYKRELDKNISNNILKGLLQFEKTKIYLSNEFTKQDLARYLKTNTTYLSIVLNVSKNNTFHQYISHLRIKYITEKLRTNKKFIRYSIKAIAEEAGYRNASAFTRKFKDIMGMTPSQYIKNL